ncbi:MAG TPA: hypothetical protein H9809_04335 [Candidatus Blautia pullicola]|uniref:ABC-2 family transporter protein n=1 Tax=Candidatus Blautia pullicola TaxID=2838498 RepID=A0A9D2FPQ3_9FIRM|nr:hypothetical protein [Candidatus Blautia pullicola]
MNKRNEIKKGLRIVFQGPEPERKEIFLKKLGLLEYSRKEFFKVQAAYISKPVWILSVLAFGCGLFGGIWWIGQQRSEEVLWGFASVLPFWALLLAVELIKSQTWRMSELEQCCRFGKREIYMARLLLLGGFDSVLFLPAYLFTAIHGNLGFLKSFCLLAVPYFLSGICLLEIVRRVKGENALWYCLFVSLLISFSCQIIKGEITLWLEGEQSVLICIGLCFLLILGAFYEIHKFFGMEEDYHEAYS